MLALEKTFAQSHSAAAIKILSKTGKCDVRFAAKCSPYISRLLWLVDGGSEAWMMVFGTAHDCVMALVLSLW